MDKEYKEVLISIAHRDLVEAYDRYESLITKPTIKGFCREVGISRPTFYKIVDCKAIVSTRIMDRLFDYGHPIQGGDILG